MGAGLDSSVIRSGPRSPGGLGRCPGAEGSELPKALGGSWPSVWGSLGVSVHRLVVVNWWVSILKSVSACLSYLFEVTWVQLGTLLAQVAGHGGKQAARTAASFIKKPPMYSNCGLRQHDLERLHCGKTEGPAESSRV